MTDVQTLELGPEWVFSCLWSQKGEKAVVDIPDTLLVCEGEVRWLYTGRQGQVAKKKKPPERELIEEVFRDNALANPQNVTRRVALVQQKDGGGRVLNEPAFQSYIRTFPAGDTSVGALQCYVQSSGHSGTIYRTTYKLTGDKGRVVLATHTFTTLAPEAKDEPVVYYNCAGSALKPMVKSAATRIVNSLTSTTINLVRFLERTQGVRITEIGMDYAVDDALKIWLLWATKATAVKGASDLRDVESIPIQQTYGRASWLGPEMGKESRHVSPSKSPPRRLSNNANNDSGNDADGNGAGRRGSKRAQHRRQSSSGATRLHQVEGAVGAVERTLAERLGQLSGSDTNSVSHVSSLSQDGDDDKREEVPLLGARMATELNAGGNGRRRRSTHEHGVGRDYPDVFKCQGDFCKLVVVDPEESLGGNDPPTGTELDQDFPQLTEVARSVLSRKELGQLVRTGQLQQILGLLSTAPCDEARATVAFKSIVLARREKRPGTKSAESNTTQQQPKHGKEKKEGNGGRLPTFAKDTRVSKGYKEYGQMISEMGGGLSKYYEQVSVCSRCWHAYTLLDKARTALEAVQRAREEELARVEPVDMVLDTTEKPPPLASSEILGQASAITSVTNLIQGRQGTHSVESSPARKKKKKKRTSQDPASDGDPLSPKHKAALVAAAEEPVKRTWKERLKEEEDLQHMDKQGLKQSIAGFTKLDDYLRGRTSTEAKRARAARESLEKDQAIIDAKAKWAKHGGRAPDAGLYHAEVLVGAEGHAEWYDQARPILDKAQYVVTREENRNKLVELALSGKYDALVLDRDLPSADLFKLVTAIRDGEKLRRKFKKEQAPPTAPPEGSAQKMIPIIVITDKCAPEDLRQYMEGGMDGCVSTPLKDQDVSLIHTLAMAVPKHMAALEQTMTTVPKFEKEKKSGVSKTGALGTNSGSTALAAATLAISANLTSADGSTSGVVQLDAQTSLPYTVLDHTIATQSMRNQGDKPYFNLVVINDFFDTHERYKILLRPMTDRYAGMQVLLWNYPGQAHTEFRTGKVLNNEYLASCLHELLKHVGSTGTKEFNTTKPFHLLGIGNGGNVATYYSAYYRNPALRAVVLVNGFSYVDPNMASILHDCLNVFTCSPPSRPDLPVYFWARFLFSQPYLAKVSTPLALNLYTAVHNPITIEGRLAILNGALDHVDLRPLLADVHMPIIAVHSTHGAISRPHHIEPYASRRGGEVRTIHRALKQDGRVHVVWIKAGHEVFQEMRQPMQILIEQLCTGFHEKMDVAFLPNISPDPDLPLDDINGKPSNQGQGAKGRGSTKPTGAALDRLFEDKFVDGVLETMSGKPVLNRQTRANVREQSKTAPARAAHKLGLPQAHPTGAMSVDDTSAVRDDQRRAAEHAWTSYSQQVGDDGVGGAHTHTDVRPEGARRRDRGTGRQQDIVTILDPNAPSFERQSNAVYEVGKGSLVYPDPTQYPEVKEYMRWRLKRNRKRFQRLDRAARLIQGAYRGHLARKVVQNMRHNRAALTIQRVFRGHTGRMRFLDRLRRVWAAQLIQRHYRAHAARLLLSAMKLRQAAVVEIQRCMRGCMGRRYVRHLRGHRYEGALVMQTCWRGYWARKLAFRRRHMRNCALQIQRVWRGHLGRRKAGVERDKYIFSKSQSQGIEFGRQMLLEHKLHATRLQSEVSILNQEKLTVEEQTEALLEEISEFEEAVSTLEKEMHQLSKIETEALGVLDQTTRLELREQKMRLDAEFGEMLGKIADRKERLTMLEKKLAELDRQRQGKEEELRTLERKLVVLLDEQQRELEAIKRRQAKKGELLLKTHEALKAGDIKALTNGEEGSAAAGAVGAYVGPSMKEKQQAAQLMQSTETLMKFGFMSMSMTYFSSLNLIRAMRTVGAQDTVMAALSANTAQSMAKGSTTGPSGGGGGGMRMGDGPTTLHEVESKYGNEAFQPTLKPGQLPGQETLRVAAWSVDDVSRWLQTLCLGQYREAFVDAAVDGAFLYDINEDDLKNSLGVEHRLHRKKILASIAKLKYAESEREKSYLLKNISKQELMGPIAATGIPPAMQLSGLAAALGQPLGAGAGGPGAGAAGGMAAGASGPAGSMTDVAPGLMGGPAQQQQQQQLDGMPRLDVKEMMSWVRHGKNGKMKVTLDPLPNRKFDPTLVRVPYVVDFGTAYLDAYEREPFNLNKVDDFGNTLLHVACQNGNDKVTRLLISKGANPNHQNKQGNTAGHYAVAYHFFDLATWLFSADGGGADDTVQNKVGFTPYDGLSVDGDDEGQSAEGPMLLTGA